MTHAYMAIISPSSDDRQIDVKLLTMICLYFTYLKLNSEPIDNQKVET